MTVEATQVFCPECEQMIAVVSSNEAVWSALKHHTCRTQHPTRGNTMSAPTLHSVPATPKRPHPRELVAHDDPRISRAAKKVVDALDKLDEAWEANAAKAELRAKAKVLEAQLAEIKAQLKGAPVQAEPAEKVDYKAVRAWAESNGWSVPKVGRISRDIVDAYYEANGH